MKKPIALVDMDGTLADFQGAMQRDLRALASPNEREEDWSKEGETYQKARWDMIKRQPDWWFNLEKLAGGFYVVDALKTIGYRVHILTRAPKKLPMAWEQKVRWCMKHLPETEITIAPRKEMVYGKVLVDDWPEYIEPWLKHRPRGLVIMPAQEWNKDFSHPQIIRHVHGQNDLEVVTALSKHYEALKEAK